MESPISKCEREGTIPIKYVRDYMLSLLHSVGSGSLCSRCPYPGRGSQTLLGCCGSCKFHDLDTGCTKRNLACLGHTCFELNNLIKKDVSKEEEFRDLRDRTEFLEGLFGRYRYADETLLRLSDEQNLRSYSGIFRFRGDKKIFIVADGSLPELNEEPHLLGEEWEKKKEHAAQRLLQIEGVSL